MSRIDEIIQTARQDARCIGARDVRALCDEIERLRNALMVYADERNWEPGSVDDDMYNKDYGKCLVFDALHVTNGWEPARKVLNDER